MARSDATTVQAYLDEQPPGRREVLEAVRGLVRGALQEGYEEAMAFGMISWQIPLERYPDTYNGRPLSYAALAAQKHHLSLYLHGVYMDEARAEALRAGFEAAGKRLDMGRSCIRFGTLDDLAADAVRDAVAAVDPDAFIEMYENARRR